MTNRIGIIGVMNPEIFNCFDEIFILTYLFADSNYDCYRRFCRIPYAYYHIADNTLCEGKFDDTAFREQCKSLIRLYSGRLNFRQKVFTRTLLHKCYRVLGAMRVILSVIFVMEGKQTPYGAHMRTTRVQ